MRDPVLFGDRRHNRAAEAFQSPRVEFTIGMGAIVPVHYFRLNRFRVPRGHFLCVARWLQVDLKHPGKVRLSTIEGAQQCLATVEGSRNA